MDHVLNRLNVGARVSLCGLISEYDNYNEHSDQLGLRNVNQLLMQRVTLRGFIVTDHVERYAEIIGKLAAALGEGSLTYDETIVEGLENARDTLNQALSGGTRGKAVIKVASPPSPV
jgi:NADPH2:quinone reductase